MAVNFNFGYISRSDAFHSRTCAGLRLASGVARNAALPGISWRGTCAKLKPLPTHASLTSLQFRALKSALAAIDSREKVQRISSVIIVHFCANPSRFVAVRGILARRWKSPAVGPAGTGASLSDWAVAELNDHRLPTRSPKAKQSSAASPPAPRERGLRAWRCHMNPGCARASRRVDSTWLSRRSPPDRSPRRSGNAVWRGGRRV